MTTMSTTKGITKGAAKGTNGRGRQATAPRPTARSMSDRHKAALAEGREQGNHVRRYLEDLESRRPRRGRKRDMARAQARLDEVIEVLPQSRGLRRVALAQERLNLESELADAERSASADTSAALADAFKGVVAEYSERKSLTFEAWREAGVPADVLRAGGMTPAGRKAASRG